MLDKILEKIENNKKDKSSNKKYIKSFVNSKKAKELFSNNDDYNELKKSLVEKTKKEDEYF